RPKRPTPSLSKRHLTQRGVQQSTPVSMSGTPCGGTLRLHPIKDPPIELYAVTRTSRRDRVTVFDLQRLRAVAFKSEPVGFQVTAVGAGGKQMHSDIVSAVARHRQVKCLG